jgi:hypothetical protein
LGKERAIRLDFIVRNLHYDNAKLESFEILLEFQIPIKGYKNLEEALR